MKTAEQKFAEIYAPESSENSATLISVIIPVHNSALWVKQTLDCVCRNSHKNLEVIAILDKPEDGSDDIVKEYAKKDSRVNVMEQPENKGMSAARNLGLSIAKGEWIHFMDSDDLLSVNFYRDMLSATDLADDIDGVLCNDITHERDKYRQVVHAPAIMSNFGDIADYTKDMVIPFWAWLMRKSFLNRINFVIPENMRIGEDYEVMPGTVDKMRKICIADGAFYVYKNRIRSATVTKSDQDRAVHDDRGHKIMNDLAQMRGAETRHDVYRGRLYFWGKVNVLHCANGVKEIIIFNKMVLRFKIKYKNKHD